MAEKSLPTTGIKHSSELITFFFCGDVMTGRGIDQVLPHPSVPHLYEHYVRDARQYVSLAEELHGLIPKPVDFSYIWGDALDILKQMAPDLRIVNLETSVTTSEEFWPGKGINYRMHPANFPCLTAAEIDVCALANNHVLDWGHQGLVETIQVLHGARIRTVGAGRSLAEAAAPAQLEIKGKGRVLVYNFGSATSGIPMQWGAAANTPGVNLLSDLSPATVRAIARQVRAAKREGDLAVASLHWGGNWGFEIPSWEVEFAHGLINEAGIDIIHGHSSHHAKGIEIYRGKPIIYGAGDFINDYEGIRGEEMYRGDLRLMYFIGMEPLTGKLAEFTIYPTRMERFRLERASESDLAWFKETLSREGKKFGTQLEASGDHARLRWQQ